jgi:Bacterial Ig-like domain/Bacterial Ig domain
MRTSTPWLGLLATCCVAILAGCPTRENGNASGLTCDPATHLCVGTLAITSPSQTAYTNGMITIQVAATPGNNPPAEVEIRVDGTMLTSVQQPFSYVWDTKNTTEGSHQVDATATIGGTTITSTPVTIWVDRTPPFIAMRTPAQNATNVALSDPIQIAFSEALDPSSVSNASVSLSSGGTTISTTASLGSDGRTVGITLGAHSTLTYPATVTVSVNAAIKDLAGNSIGSLPSWSWTAPLWVKMPSLAATLAYVALDPTGRGIVAYLTDPGSGSRTLAVAQYAAGAVWDMTIGSPAATASVAAIAVGADAAPVVAWSDIQDTHVLAARWSGTSWNAIGGDIEASVPAVDSVQVSSLVITPSGTPMVGWSGQRGTNSYGYVASSSIAAWQALPPGVFAGIGSPLLRLDSKGNPVGIFSGYIGVPRIIEQYETGSWTSIDSETGLLDAAVNSQDQVVALVTVTESSVSVFHLRVPGAPGSGFTELTPTLPTGSPGTIEGGRLVFAANGNPIVLWTQEDTSSSNNRLYVARFNGTAWDTTFGVLSGVAGNNGSVQGADLAVDSAGEPTVAWSEEDTTINSVAVYVWKSNY